MNENKKMVIGIVTIIIFVLAIAVPYLINKFDKNVLDFNYKTEKTTITNKKETTTTSKTTERKTTPTTTQAADDNTEKLNVYVFYGDGCPHCSALHAYFEDLKTKDIGKKINIHYYEVWQNDDNHKLLETVAKEMKIEVGGVPFFIIGDKYFEGYSESMNDQILSALNKTYNYDVMNAID